MEILVIVAILAVVFLLIKINRQDKNLIELQKESRDNIKNLNDTILNLSKEKDEAFKQIDLYKQKTTALSQELTRTNEELKFYKNIEKDSGTLNVQYDGEREKNLEQAIEQYKLSQNNIESPNSILDCEQAAILHNIESSNENFFITGKAGTGKSFLLDVFRKTTSKSHIILAPTGIAALNVKGATLHSTFGYDNLVKLNADTITSQTIKLKSEKQILLKKVSTIVIDEVSMIRSDTFEKIDRILKVINHNNLPFGGKQIILFGDLFQLPPVTKQNENEYLIDKYGGVHFFFTNSYKLGNFKFCELTINHRQKDDERYFELLNRVRDGSITNSDIEMLNSRVDFDPSIYNRFTTLLPTKAEVELLNLEHIRQLSGREFTYQAEVVLNNTSNYNLEAIFPINNILRLKVGALIMMVANDPEHRWVNGTLGIIKNLSSSSITVAINERIYEIHPCDFSQQEIVYENGAITYKDVLWVKQFPIVLAYAITIHKSQGQTYNNIVCDIDRCFADGQAYVALSRCSSLEGLHLKRAISGASIHVDKNVLNFYNEQINHIENFNISHHN